MSNDKYPQGPPYTMTEIQSWAREELGHKKGWKAEATDQCTQFAVQWWVMNGWVGNKSRKVLEKKCRKYVKDEYKNQNKRHGFDFILPLIISVLISSLISTLISRLVDWWFSDEFKKAGRESARHLVYAWADAKSHDIDGPTLAELERKAIVVEPAPESEK